MLLVVGGGDDYMKMLDMDGWMVGSSIKMASGRQKGSQKAKPHMI